MTATYAFSERALIWIDPETNYLAIDIFDLPREQFELVTPDPSLTDRLITTNDNLPDAWVRTVARTVKITVHIYTEQPSQEVQP